MLEIKNLRKTFGGGRPALDDVSFSVKRGEVFGLLGHNGAGKSTALGIMLGMVRPDAGDVTIGGISVLEDRSRALAKVGAIFEAPCFYNYLSGWRNLKVLTGYSGYWDDTIFLVRHSANGPSNPIQFFLWLYCSLPSGSDGRFACVFHSRSRCISPLRLKKRLQAHPCACCTRAHRGSNALYFHGFSG